MPVAWFRLLNLQDLTIMVTKVESAGARAKVSTPPAPRLRWAPIPPALIDDSNRIITGPIYELQQVKVLVVKHGLYIVNDAANAAMRGEGTDGLPPPVWTAGDVVRLISSLESTDYVNSQWCATSARMKIDCDAYAVHYSRERGRWQLAEKVYVKFGYSQNTGSSMALVCSVHRAQR